MLKQPSLRSSRPDVNHVAGSNERVGNFPKSDQTGPIAHDGAVAVAVGLTTWSSVELLHKYRGEYIVI